MVLISPSRFGKMIQKVNPDERTIQYRDWAAELRIEADSLVWRTGRERLLVLANLYDQRADSL